MIQRSCNKRNIQPLQILDLIPLIGPFYIPRRYSYDLFGSASRPDTTAQESLRVTAWVASSGSMEGLFRMEVAVLSCSRLDSTTANTKQPEYSSET